MNMGVTERRHEPDEGAPWEARAPLWFWIVAGGCLIWSGLGAMDYTLTNLHVGPYVAQMPPGMVAFLARLPVWVVGAWALGVWGSLAGALLLMVRVRHAAVAYALSFAGAVGALAWEYSHGALAVGRGFVPVAGMVLGGILAQLWFSRAMFWRGVLR